MFSFGSSVFCRTTVLADCLDVKPIAWDDSVMLWVFAQGRYQLGVALFSLGEYEAAMDEFAKGLTECPGNTSFKLGFEAAQRESRKALVLLPVYPSSPVTTATPSQYSQYSSPSKSIPR